jgi:hypothetical protein
MNFLNFNHHFTLRHSKNNNCGKCFDHPIFEEVMFWYRDGTRVIELEAIMGWAKSHLSLGGGESKYDIVVIPYHGEAHWSLLVLEPSHTFHVEVKIGVHAYSTRDIFIQRIYGALLLLQGVHPSDPTFNELVEKPMLNVPIFTHVGNWECGYVTSHNLCQHHKHTLK